MGTSKPGIDPAVSIVERIDALCDRFEAAWKSERRPDLLEAARLDDEEVQMLQELKGARHGRD